MTKDTLETDEKLEYLKPYLGKVIMINGKPFKLSITKDMGGDLITWSALDNSYIIHATINYDNFKGVPFSLCDGDGCVIDGDSYPCELDKKDWFAEYCGIVKAVSGKLINEYENKKDNNKPEWCDQCGEETTWLTYLDGCGWCCPRCHAKYQ